MIEIVNLTKSYGKKKAVDDISFTVEKGEILGFLGPNGAGKSTTMNILTGYISATSGKVLVDGMDILEKPIEVKKKIGYLPELPPLYLSMTVDEYLEFVFDLKKVKLDRKKHLDEIKELVKITDVSHRLIRNLSKGYRQRVGLAQALVGNPEVLILDEPTVGLDPKQIIDIRNLISQLGKEHTIILSSHILSEVSAVCQRVIIINQGKIVAIDTPENLSENMTSQLRLTITVEGDPQAVLDAFRKVEGVKNAAVIKEKTDGTADYLVESDFDIRKEISQSLAGSGLVVLAMQNEAMSLEDIFLKLTQSKEEEQDAGNL